MKMQYVWFCFFGVVFNPVIISASNLDQFVTPDFKRNDHYRHQICNLQDVNNYVRRYINTFLRYTKLANKGLLNEVAGDDFIHAKMHLRLTGDQLALLQKIYYERNYVPSLEDLDQVFSSIMYQSTADDVQDYLDWLLSSFEMTYWVLDISLPQAISFAIFAMFLYNWLLRGISRMLISQTFAAFIVLEGVKRYQFKLREANLQYYLEMKKQGVLAEECNTSQMGILAWSWVSFKNLFREDPCVQAYMQATSHYAEKVSLVECMMEPLLSAMSLVMKYIGIFVQQISQGMIGDGYFGQALSVFIYPLVLFAIIGSIFHIFFSTNIHFSTYFASVGISKSNNHPPVQPAPQPPPPPVHPPLENYIRDLRALLRLTRPIKAGTRKNSKRQFSASRFPLETPPEPVEHLEIEEKSVDNSEEPTFVDAVETLEETKDATKCTIPNETEKNQCEDHSSPDQNSNQDHKKPIANFADDNVATPIHSERQLTGLRPIAKSLKLPYKSWQHFRFPLKKNLE